CARHSSYMYSSTHGLDSW
nr:immunoglobulin heavy chain junction region [Macaca mulatta]